MWKPASVAFLGCLLLLDGLILSLAVKFWGRRKELMIKARKPELVMVSVVSAMVSLLGVFVQWILEVERGKAPCLLPLIITYTSGYNFVMPTLVRAIHVIIMTNRTLRNKYSWMLRDKFLWSALAVIFAGEILAGVLFWLTSAKYRPEYEGTCVMYQEWSFFLTVLVVYVPVAIILIIQLGKVKDLLRMALELTIVIGWAGGIACLFNAYLIVTDVQHLPRSSLINAGKLLVILN
ncbi:unnamed protein product, partial [Chrysoparadoxa australica]